MRPLVGQPLWEAFRAHVDRTPDALAVVVGTQRLTYRELDLASAALARRLLAAHARPGMTVGLCLEQSTTTVAGQLAALRIGLAWAVIEPDQPASRLQALVAATDCAAVIHSGGWERDHLPGVPLIDTELVDLRSPEPVPTVELSEELVAYLVFTSGSTGQPKLVAVSRRSLALSTASRADIYGPSRPVFLSSLRLSFDGSLDALCRALGRGGTVVLPGARRLRDVTELAALAAAWQVTHLIISPAFYRLLLEQDGPWSSALELVVVGGETCPSELAAAHYRRLPAVDLVNAYGPTEVAICSNAHRVPDRPVDSVPIGAALPGYAAHVLDERLCPVPAGTVGELYIGGRALAYGYAGQPGRTAERFVADPFSRQAGRPMYRTGDLVLAEPDGQLHFRGRVDDQVQVRGVRVELGEVRGALEQHPAVAAAVVAATTDDRGDPILVAFWLAREGEPEPSAQDLRRHCRARLIDEMVPHRCERVTSIPLDQNGKVDRAALLCELSAGGDMPVVEPAGQWTTGTERTVGDMWSAVLGHRDFGPRDDFFMVGGDSVRLIALHKRFQQSWPAALRVGELFDLTTVRAQAAEVARRVDPRPSRAADTGGASYEL